MLIDNKRLKRQTIHIFNFLLFWSVSFLHIGTCHAVDNWDVAVRDEENDVVVYTRTLSSGDTEFKGITHVKASLSACVALLRDVDAMPEWVDRTVMAKVLRWVSDTEVYAYHITSIEYPFIDDRDAIVHTLLVQDPVTLAVTIKGKGILQYDGESLFDYQANEKKYTRMTKVESFWRFEPIDNGKVKITFQGYGDLGGNLSSSLIKFFMQYAVWESPYETLKNMREIIVRSKYKNARFDFIKDVRGNSND